MQPNIYSPGTCSSLRRPLFSPRIFVIFKVVRVTFLSSPMSLFVYFIIITDKENIYTGLVASLWIYPRRPGAVLNRTPDFELGNQPLFKSCPGMVRCDQVPNLIISEMIGCLVTWSLRVNKPSHCPVMMENCLLPIRVNEPSHSPMMMRNCLVPKG